MNRQRFFALLLTLLLVVGCNATATNNADEPAPDSATPTVGDESTSEETPADSELTAVRVGIVPVTIYAPFYIALDKGYFAEEGLDVELVPVEGGTENVVQLAAGNFEFAGGGVGAGLWNAAERGVEFEIIAPLHTERPPLTSPFVVSKARYESGELTSMSDLAGLTVSTNAKGAATEYWLYKALEQGGLGFEDVTVTGVGFREVAAALESGTLDGAILGEPLVTLAEQEGLVARLSEDFIDDFTSTVVYVNKEWAAANPTLVEGFVRAYLRGARDLNGDAWFDEANLAIIEANTGVPAAIVANANRSYHDPNGDVPVEDIAILQEFFKSQGELSYDELLDIAPYVNTSYAEAAVESLGGRVAWEK
ncbi:MAG: ABC transporter substrate-binding protein [Ardenticatenales bacterium]|nr:ABC transporter substrate-binding protein [Ardenticatenales bacterium]